MCEGERESVFCVEAYCISIYIYIHIYIYIYIFSQSQAVCAIDILKSAHRVEQRADFPEREGRRVREREKERERKRERGGRGDRDRGRKGGWKTERESIAASA